MNKNKPTATSIQVSRPKTIVSDRRKQLWDKYTFMPKSLMNRPFIDMSAFHKISEDGELSITQEIQLSNFTGPNSEYNTENLFMEQKKLGRIKMLQTPNSQLRSTAYGTTNLSFNNIANKTSKIPSFTDRIGKSKFNDKSVEQPSLPLINIKRVDSEIVERGRRESGSTSQDVSNSKKYTKQKEDKKYHYHKPIFDNYEPIKYNMTTGEWEMTNIVKNTRFINIEKDLKDRMRVKGRFPIPDPIKKSKEHPRNDENIILRADSLIESAYDSEKGEEWVKNEDFIIPGILSPLQSEISMHKVDLYSSTDEEEDELLNDVSTDAKRKRLSSSIRKGRKMSK